MINIGQRLSLSLVYLIVSRPQLFSDRFEIADGRRMRLVRFGVRDFLRVGTAQQEHATRGVNLNRLIWNGGRLLECDKPRGAVAGLSRVKAERFSDQRFKAFYNLLRRLVAN